MVNAVRMNADILAYALLGGLAITLLVSIYTDIKYRLILNKITLTIALAAPLYWYASGDFTLTAIGIHLLTSLLAFGFFLIWFRFGMMGGGDVKLFAALALWFPWNDVVRMIFYAAILGGLVTIVFALIHKAKQQDGPIKVPYGVAIALAGLWMAGERFFNHYA